MFHKLENRKNNEVLNVLCSKKFGARAYVSLFLSLSLRDLNSLSNLFNVDVLFTNTRISVYYVRVRAEKSFHWKNASEQPTPRSFHSETSAKIPNFIFPSPFSLFLSLFFSSSSSSLSSFSSFRNGKNRDRTRSGKGKRERGRGSCPRACTQCAFFRDAENSFSPFSSTTRNSPFHPLLVAHSFSFPGFFPRSNEGCSTFRALKKIHRFPSRWKTASLKKQVRAPPPDQERRINFSLWPFLKGLLLHDAIHTAPPAVTTEACKRVRSYKTIDHKTAAVPWINYTR